MIYDLEDPAEVRVGEGERDLEDEGIDDQAGQAGDQIPQMQQVASRPSAEQVRLHEVG